MCTDRVLRIRQIWADRLITPRHYLLRCRIEEVDLTVISLNHLWTSKLTVTDQIHLHSVANQMEWDRSDRQGPVWWDIKLQRPTSMLTCSSVLSRNATRVNLLYNQRVSNNMRRNSLFSNTRAIVSNNKNNNSWQRVEVWARHLHLKSLPRWPRSNQILDL